MIQTRGRSNVFLSGRFCRLRYKIVINIFRYFLSAYRAEISIFNFSSTI